MYKKGQQGVYRDKPDHRDFRFGALGAVEFDWEKGFELDVPLKVEQQGNSLSCVGQSYSKYAEVLNYYDEQKVFTDLSAKSVYGLIALPGGGAYLRDGAKMVVKRGVNKETTVPSYPASGAVTEQFMTEFVDNEALRLEAERYESQDYYSVGCTIDELAQAIKVGKGVVFAVTGSNPGWKTADVRIPKTGETQWGHAVFGVGAMMRNGKKTIKFINSWGGGWGDKGFGYLSEDYFVEGQKYVFPGWTLVDKINKDSDMQCVKDKSGSNIYLIINGKKILIIDMPTYVALGLPAFTEADVSIYPDGGSFVWTERKLK